MSNPEQITVTIDGQSIQVPAGTTILDAARQVGIEIPVICYHPHLTANALCRICVVEPARGRTLAPACVATCMDGMSYQTQSERVCRSRKVILELLHSTVDCSEAPDIQRYSEQYGVDPERFADGKRREFLVYDDNPFYIRDYDKCILCWRCVQICADDAQYTFALNLGGRGFDSHVATFFDAQMPDTTCVFCGNCVNVCPTGALKSKQEWLMEQGLTIDEIRERTRATRRMSRGKR